MPCPYLPNIREILTSNALQDVDTDFSIPFRVEPDGPGDGEWHWVHDFFHGYGWVRKDKDRVRSFIWVRDVDAYYPGMLQSLELTPSQSILDEIHGLLVPKLLEEEQRLAAMPPPKFDRITIPRFKEKPMPSDLPVNPQTMKDIVEAWGFDQVEACLLKNTPKSEQLKAKLTNLILEMWLGGPPVSEAILAACEGAEDRMLHNPKCFEQAFPGIGWAAVKKAFYEWGYDRAADLNTDGQYDYLKPVR